MQNAEVEHAAISFIGELTIRTIGESYERLQQAFASASSVVAQFAADVTVDLTLVQLIESARRTARETGCEFALAAPAAGQLRETLERGGFLAAPQHRAFWLMETEGR